MGDPLCLTAGPAAEYLSCYSLDLIIWADRGWIAPVRRLPGDVGPGSGARLWRRSTLERAKPFVSEWRERDCAAAAAAAAEPGAKKAAAKARRVGMRKGRAMTATKVREQLNCSRMELNRGAADGRLPPEREVVLYGVPSKMVAARAWLPGTVEAAKLALEDWRAQDRATKQFNRRGLRPVA